MVLSIQTKLLHYIDEHLTSYLELCHHLAASVNALAPIDNQQFLTALGTSLQQYKLNGLQSSHDPLVPNVSPGTIEIQFQSTLLNEHALCVELRAEAPHTLLFAHFHELDMPHSHVQELASIAAVLSALDSCKNVLGSVPVNIQWLITDTVANVNLEELGMLQPDGCIWYHAAETLLGRDGTPIVATGTKGHLSVELQVQTASKPIDSMHGGVVPDALWRLLWALGALKDAHEDIRIDGFYDTLTPVQDDVMAQLHSLPDSSNEQAQRWGIPQLLMGLQGFQFHYAHLLLPTCTVSNITRSVQPTGTGDERAGALLPIQAKAQVDFYLVPDQEPLDIFSKVQSHLQGQGFADVQARICSASRPRSTPSDNPFVQLAIAATEKAYARAPYVLPTTVGGYAGLVAYMNDKIPGVFMARNELNVEENPEAFGSMIKQIALLIGGMDDGANTAE